MIKSSTRNGRPKTVVLQSHVDMVCQKNEATDFDFMTEGIRMVVDGDWVRADGTTLGADNGIGVASILAVLESSDIPTPRSKPSSPSTRNGHDRGLGLQAVSLRETSFSTSTPKTTTKSASAGRGST